MRWTLPGDHTEPIITAAKHISSEHGSGALRMLPETCVLFEMGMALPFLESAYPASVLWKELPCFIADSRCVRIDEIPNVCFVQGGYGAPAAVDTLETIRALGAKRIVVAGMCGGYSTEIQVCDVVIPDKVFCEEGTSFHYYEAIEFATPDESLFHQAVEYFRGRQTILTRPTVSSDAFYRQTFAKEALWREKGCVGVDTESSALLSVSRYYGMPAVTLLFCSDKHPVSEADPPWRWGDGGLREKRRAFVRDIVEFAKRL